MLALTLRLFYPWQQKVIHFIPAYKFLVPLFFPLSSSSPALVEPYFTVSVFMTLRELLSLSHWHVSIVFLSSNIRCYIHHL